MPEQAVLLVNLGSPASTSVPDVRRYLRAFLGDERVIDYPAWFRFLLLEGIILRVRPKKSAHAYSQVWTPEGAPLPVTTEKVRAKLETALGLPVLAGMRYEEPSITGALEKLRDLGVREVFLIPQYPHYAMSSWETVVVKVYEEARRVAPGLRFTTVQPFFADTDYIEALHTVSAPAARRRLRSPTHQLPRRAGAPSAQGRFLARAGAASQVRREEAAGNDPRLHRRLPGDAGGYRRRGEAGLPRRRRHGVSPDSLP